ncbi:MAG: asparaginase [Clostridia bacterium]|nr:asparaginase [Clostridia bacterium]
MKILFVFTGGTIGSTQKSGVISFDTTKSYKIINEYEKRYGIDFDYDVREPYIALSEDNTGDNLRMLVSCVRENLYSGYDGIIVTHGTDTLQYSSAAIGYAIGLDTIPVCVVSANAPIENEGSNAMDNLRGAVSFIKASLGRGAFTVYRNAGSDLTFVHRATRLTGVTAFSDRLDSIFGSAYGYFDRTFDFVKNRDFSELPDMQAPIDISGLSARSDKIMMLTPYVGMRYPKIDGDVGFVVISTFHSGTIDTLSPEARGFFAEAREKNIPLLALGVPKGTGYSGMSLYEDLGIIPIKNIAPIAAYVKLWMLESSGRGDVISLVQTSLSGDKVF